MYEILVERTAEKDIKHLPPAVLRRVIPAIKSFSLIPRPLVAVKSQVRKMLGGSESATIVSFTKSTTKWSPSKSCA